MIKYFTGGMPLHSFSVCGGPEALSLTTFLRKCGVKTASAEEQERYIMKTNLELPYANNNIIHY